MPPKLERNVVSLDGGAQTGMFFWDMMIGTAKRRDIDAYQTIQDTLQGQPALARECGQERVRREGPQVGAGQAEDEAVRGTDGDPCTRRPTTLEAAASGRTEFELAVGCARHAVVGQPIRLKLPPRALQRSLRC